MGSSLSSDQNTNFEDPSDTKKNKIMDLKLEYQTFKAKPTESLSQTYTRYKTLLNELTNDGLRNANHTQTLDLADIYGRFFYEDNLIQRRYSDTKKALITTPSSTAISTAFFSNNVIQDFQENSDDEVDERSSEEYLRDLDIEFHERALLANSKLTGYSSVSKGFQPKFTPKLIQSSQNSISQADPKIQKDYKAEYKKMKAKLALLKQIHLLLRTQRPSNQRTKVKVLMALADDEFTVGKNNARNGEWIDITMRKFVEEQRLNLLSKYNKIVFELNKCRDELLVLKQAKLDAVTFQIQNTELTKLNHALQEQLKEEKKINEKWLTSLKKVSQ
ncbi:hypothetical protein Tco_1302020 [Tanacetum coccineum]